MNRAQLIVLWMGLAVIVAMQIVPPPVQIGHRCTRTPISPRSFACPARVWLS